MVKYMDYNFEKIKINLKKIDMKYIGFIKEYDNISEATSFTDILGENTNDLRIINNILNHLDNSTVIFGLMHYVDDLETKEHAVPHYYCSDGEWIWPSYFPYYVRKYMNYNLDNNFVHYCLKQKNNNTELKKDTKEKIFKTLLHKLENG
jgi:hypothetical protein